MSFYVNYVTVNLFCVRFEVDEFASFGWLTGYIFTNRCVIMCVYNFLIYI